MSSDPGLSMVELAPALFVGVLAAFPGGGQLVPPLLMLLTVLCVLRRHVRPRKEPRA